MRSRRRTRALRGSEVDGGLIGRRRTQRRLATALGGPTLRGGEKNGGLPGGRGSRVTMSSVWTNARSGTPTVTGGKMGTYSRFFSWHAISLSRKSAPGNPGALTFTHSRRRAVRPPRTRLGTTPASRRQRSCRRHRGMRPQHRRRASRHGRTAPRQCTDRHGRWSSWSRPYPRRRGHRA